MKLRVPDPVQSSRRIAAVAKKEVRQLARDKLTQFFLIGVPLLQLALFGYAINQDVRQLKTAVLDRSQTAVSRRLLGQLAATQTFRMTTAVTTEREGRDLLERGAVQAFVLVPEDFARRTYRGRGAQVFLLVDAADPLAARAAQAAADGLSRELAGRVEVFRAGEEGAMRSSTGPSRRFETRPDLVRSGPISLVVFPAFNPELRTPVFVVPGLLGVILTTTMILMTSLALVRERERGSFEFLIGTPVTRLELMAGKILPYVVIGLVQIYLILGGGLLLFGVPVRGSLVDLGVASLFFIAASLTVGLTISARVQTQLQATHVAFFYFLPSVLLSGFMFPYEAMPRPAQWLGELLPITHYIRLCRSILLRGASVWEMPGELLALTLLGALGLTVAVSLFRKRLD